MKSRYTNDKNFNKTSLYVYEFKGNHKKTLGEHFIKVGITSAQKVGQRFQKYKNYYEYYDIKKIYFKRYNNYKQAYKIEQKILNFYKPIKYTRKPGIYFSGHIERLHICAGQTRHRIIKSITELNKTGQIRTGISKLVELIHIPEKENKRAISELRKSNRLQMCISDIIQEEHLLDIGELQIKSWLVGLAT